MKSNSKTTHINLITLNLKINLMKKAKLVNITILTTLPYATLIYFNSQYISNKTILINILSFISLTLISLISSGKVGFCIKSSLSILYLIMLTSILSYNDFINYGAFSSIMESNLKESLGYITEFGFSSIIFGIALSLVFSFFIFKTKVTTEKNVLPFLYLLLLTSSSINLYQYTKSDRLISQFKSSPFMSLSSIYKHHFISPILLYLAYSEERKFLSLPDSFELPRNITTGQKSKYKKIYLVLGESSSSRNYSYNGYKYPTSPYLDIRKNDSRFFWIENTISSSPITRESLKRALSFATVNNGMRYSQYINIINAAKTKKFETFWLSSQSKQGINDSITNKIGSSADESIFNVNDDADLINLVSTRFNKSKNQFFVLHLTGSHAPYANYYKNDYDQLVSLGDKNAAYNATIKKTDRILNNIMRSLSNSNDSLVIYFSDHGEVIGKGHGLPDPSKEQFDVPFFIFDTTQNPQSNLDFIGKLSVNGTFNTQMVMEVVLNALGFQFTYIDKENPFSILHSSGDILDYRQLMDKYHD